MTAKTDSTTKRTSGITPEQARDVRARAWAYVFECLERRQDKKAAGVTSTNGDNGAKGPEKDDRPAPPILPR